MSARNALKPKPSMDDTQKHYAESLDPGAWQTSPGELFRAEKELVESALNGSTEDFLKVFPSKVFFNEIANVLGIVPKEYAGLICRALSATGDTNAPLHTLGNELEKVLEPSLPPRKLSSE